MNEAIATKALENLRARVAAVEADRDRLAGLLDETPHHYIEGIGDPRCLCGNLWPCTGDRDRLAEQVEDGVRRFFADADIEGHDLNAMTVEQLTDAVMHAIRADGTGAGS